VLTVMGVGGSSTTGFVHDLPLIIAFLILAGYTFVSGLRAPALITFIKDTLIYVMIIVAIIYIPIRVGGWGTSSASPTLTSRRSIPRPASRTAA
jgi:SSS family solute:Na+ symporter